MKYVHEDTKFPIKMWTDHVPVEDGAMQQLRNIANMPFIHILGKQICNFNG